MTGPEVPDTGLQQDELTAAPLEANTPQTTPDAIGVPADTAVPPGVDTSAAGDNPSPAVEVSPAPHAPPAAMAPAAPARPAASAAPPTAAAPRPWPGRILQLERDGAMPPLLAAPELVDDRWVLYPWRPCRDVCALLAWARVLQEPPLVAQVRPIGHGQHEIRIRGVLAGELVELVGSTARGVNLEPIGGGRVPARTVGAIALAELERAAQLEQQIADGRTDAARPTSPTTARAADAGPPLVTALRKELAADADEEALRRRLSAVQAANAGEGW